MLSGQHPFFLLTSGSTNLLLGMALISLIYAGGWEFSVHQYLRGFCNAIVPAEATSEQKAEAILSWMRVGPPRTATANPAVLSQRDPETTLNCQQLVSVCGTATNAFLNLARRSGLSARRLLLLNTEHTVKHVAAEVLIDGRWVVADAAYRVLLRDSHGHLLTRNELRDPVIFAQATSAIPNSLPEYSYESVAHVRLARSPMERFHLRSLLDAVAPGWEELTNGSLLLERESFFVFARFSSLLFFFLRTFLAWCADHRLNIPRFRLRERAVRVGTAFFSRPELK